jgi:hypothetical protein
MAPLSIYGSTQATIISQRPRRLLRIEYSEELQDRLSKPIEYLNASNAILSKLNAQLVALTCAGQQAKKGEKAIRTARVVSKQDTDQLRADIETKRELA